MLNVHHSYPHYVFTKTPEPCPPDYSKRGLGQSNPSGDTVYWSLVSSNKDKFYKALFDKTGISPDNIAMKDIHHSQCPPSDTEEECKRNKWDIG